MSTYGAAQLAASFRTVRKNTIQIAEEIPEEQYGFTAAPGTRTVAQMLVHIAVATRIWLAISKSGVSTLEGFDFMTPFQGNMAEEQKSRTKAEIVALLQSEGEAYATHVAGLSDEFLAGDITQPDGQSSKSRLETMLGAKEHEMHHRSQLMVAERLLGITPHLTRAMQERFASMQAAAKA
ncbi:MAG: DinB family protein [Bryobacterales bacterium]|nr:DinB family protein [Bryobacterales bacterium]